MKKYYTLFFGNELWEDVVDDMNSSEGFGYGGKIWTNKQDAKDCMKNLKQYDFETKDSKFSIREVFI